MRFNNEDDAVFKMWLAYVGCFGFTWLLIIGSVVGVVIYLLLKNFG